MSLQIRGAAAVVNVYYRISSSSYQKGKLPGASKEVCLRNFLETFPPEQHPFTILTDNCDEDYLEGVRLPSLVISNPSGT